jgi:hypothetical protein
MSARDVVRIHVARAKLPGKVSRPINALSRIVIVFSTLRSPTIMPGQPIQCDSIAILMMTNNNGKNKIAAKPMN